MEDIFLDICGYVIKVEFLKTDNVIIQKNWFDLISVHWCELVIGQKKREVDYIIELSDIDKDGESCLRMDDGDYFRLQKFYINKRKVVLSYFGGLMQFNMILKDILLRLIKNEGFLLHGSSCISRDGFLNIFMAVSGGGKSTTTKMLENQGYGHFSDDVIVVKKENSRYVYYRPPFIEKSYGIKKGEWGGVKCKIFFVNRNSKDVRIELILDEFEIMKRLVASVVLLKEKEINKKVMSFMAGFINQNKFYYLYRNLSEKKLIEVLNEVE